MLVGYIIHSWVMEGGDNGWWCVRDGTAVFEQGLVLQRHLIFVNTQGSVVVAVVISFEKSCKRSSSPGELGDCGIGLVSVLCFVFYHLPVVLLLLILSPTPCFSWVLNTVWYNDSNSTWCCQDCLWAYQWQPEWGWRKPVISSLPVFETPSE